MFHTIVVGFDGSKQAEQALGAAAHIAATSPAAVHIVVAYHAPTAAQVQALQESVPAEFAEAVTPLAGAESLAQQAKSLLDGAGEVFTHEVADRPASALINVASDVGADLIVVGSRGLGAGTRLLKGSVSTKVSHQADCSVLVVHDDAR